ncbi:MAG: DUF6527 family protein [Terracidiphilus sp.]
MAKIVMMSNCGCAFFCPGCKRTHSVNTEGARNLPRVWKWNGNVYKPTFKPSIHVVWENNPHLSKAFNEKRMRERCHFFVRAGKIHFFRDCTHELAGKTVELPDWEEPKQ